MKFFTSSLFALAAFTLASCARGDIRPYRYGEGYSSVQIDEKTFEVSINGPEGMTGMQIRDYFLCQTAELALVNGARYFVLLQSAISKDVRPDVIVAGTEIVHQAQRVINPQSDPELSWTSTTLQADNVRYGRGAVVRLYSDIPTDAEYYDAQLIREKMVPKMRRSVRRSGKDNFFRQLLQIVFFVDRIKQ